MVAGESARGWGEVLVGLVRPLMEEEMCEGSWMGGELLLGLIGASHLAPLSYEVTENHPLVWMNMKSEMRVFWGLWAFSGAVLWSI